MLKGVILEVTVIRKQRKIVVALPHSNSFRGSNGLMQQSLAKKEACHAAIIHVSNFLEDFKFSLQVRSYQSLYCITGPE